MLTAKELMLAVKLLAVKAELDQAQVACKGELVLTAKELMLAVKLLAVKAELDQAQVACKGELVQERQFQAGCLGTVLQHALGFLPLYTAMWRLMQKPANVAVGSSGPWSVMIRCALP